MATNYPRQIATRDIASVDLQGNADGLGTRVMDRVRQVLCGLRGHDNLLQFERDRMFLRCASCGRETPGWELTEAAPIAVAPMQVGTETAHALPQGQLISARRIA